MSPIGSPRRDSLLAAALAAFVLAGLVALGTFSLIETEFMPQGGPFGVPGRIPACGRSFTGGVGTITWTDVMQGISAGSSPIVFEPVIGEIPLTAPFESHPRPTGVATCDTLVFLHVGPDAYVAYGLEGGP